MMFDTAVLVLLLAGALFVFLPRLRKRGRSEEAEAEPQIGNVQEFVRECLKERMYREIGEMGLNRQETEKQEQLQRMLLEATERCCSGDRRYREYCLDYIRQDVMTYLKKHGFSPDDFIPFSRPEWLDSRDQHDILLYHYRYHLDCGENALHHFLEKAGAGKPLTTVTAAQLEECFQSEEVILTETEKVDLLAERIFADSLGLGPIDVMRYTRISGISVGTGGLPEQAAVAGEEETRKNHENIWVLYQGDPVKLDYLTCKNEKELIRIVRRAYKNEVSAELSADVGGLYTDARDGSRITVMRPGFSDSGWAVIIRRHAAKDLIDLHQVIRGAGTEPFIRFLRLLTIGCQVIAITGNAGTGKTTLLRALLQFLVGKYTIRIFEEEPELKANEYYPEANIITLRNTPKMDGQKSLDFMKKTDGRISVIGESANAESISWVVQTAQMNSETSLFTCHAMTTPALIDYTRNALVNERKCSDTAMAEQQAVSVLRFDIHLTAIGRIERITEIVPEPDPSNRKCYRCVDIVRLGPDGYEITGEISSGTRESLFRKFTEADQEEYRQIFRPFQERKAGGLT